VRGEDQGERTEDTAPRLQRYDNFGGETKFAQQCQLVRVARLADKPRLGHREIEPGLPTGNHSRNGVDVGRP
jgi:hypothetical protein